MSQDFEGFGQAVAALLSGYKALEQDDGVLADLMDKGKGDNLETVVSISEVRSFLSSRNQNLAQVEEFFSVFALKLISTRAATTPYPLQV